MKTVFSFTIVVASLAWIQSASSAEIVVTREFPYPSQWTDPQVQAGTSSTTGGSGSVGIAAPSPSSFAVREVGVRLYVHAVIGSQPDTGISIGKAPSSGRLRDGNTSLMMAAASGDEATVKTLLETVKEVNDKNRFGSTALMGAASGGYQEIVNMLAARGAEINLANRDGVTPLMMAAKNGHDAIVRLLLEKDAQVNARDNSDQTVLMYAVAGGHLRIAQALLDKGANVKMQSRYGATPLATAKAKRNQDLVVLLTKAGATK